MGNLTEKMRLVPEHLIPCVTSEGFFQEIIRRWQSPKSLMDTYEELEYDYETHFRQRKFSSFSSFRVMFYRYIKQKKEKKK
jgi:hypothetical protein